MTKLTLKEINEIDIVDFLESIGYHPEKIEGQNYKYISMLPDRFEKTPSFIVNRKRNRWKDFGNGAGTTLVSFCMLYYKWTVRELVENLSGKNAAWKIVTQNRPLIDTVPEPRIEIIKIHEITSFYLTR